MRETPLLLLNAALRPGPWCKDAPSSPVWIAIRGGVISEIGSPGQPAPDSDFDRIDLDGAILLPGFVDAHTHLGWSAEDRWTVNLAPARSRKEVLDCVRVVASRVTPGDWVTGGDWLPTNLPDAALPSKDELDSVCGERPLFLVSRDHTRGLVNSVALRIAGVGAKTADPEGGVIDRSPDGDPNGIIRGEAVWSRLIAGTVTPRDRARSKAEIDDALGDLAERGVTEIHDIGTIPEHESRPSFFRERSFTDATLIAELGDRLSLRYLFRASLLRAEELTASPPSLPGMVEFAGFKMSLDNGWYSTGDAQRVDSFRWPGFDEVVRLAKIADRAGLPISLHTIGDLGVAEAIDVIATLGRRTRGSEAAHRIIHARRMAVKDVQRAGELGIAVEVQPWEIINSGQLLSSMGDEEFAEGISPYRSLVDAGAQLVFGSDRRLGLRVDQLDTDPLTAVQLSVTRSLEKFGGPWQPEQALTLTQAFAAATTTGADVAGAAQVRGRISLGYQADLMALSADPWAGPPGQIASARPVLTVSGGRVVFDGGVNW